MKVCKIDKKFYAKCISSNKCPSYNHKTKNCIYQKNFLTADQLLTVEEMELENFRLVGPTLSRDLAILMYQVQQRKLKG